MAGKITVLIGSPRANGISAKIAKAIADECQAMGKEVATFHLDKIEGLRGCRACNACKKRGGCIAKDPTLPILESIAGSEGIVLSTPLYFNVESGQLKLVLDRFYGFLSEDFKTFLPGTQKAAVVVSCMTGEESPEDCASHPRQVCSMCGIPPVGTKAVCDPGDEKNTLTPEILERAKDIAHKL